MSRRQGRTRQAAVAPEFPPPADGAVAVPVAAIDVGASAIRMVIAQAHPDGRVEVLDDLSRGVLLGKDTFTIGRLSAGTIEAALRALDGFRRLMDTYKVDRYRAVATSAVREASNRDSFLDRVKVRTGIEVEAIDGSEEIRLTYLAVREMLKGHPAMTSGTTLLAEIGGGSGDLTLLRDGEPLRSGTYALGAIRLRQGLGSFHGTHEQWLRLLRRHIHNVVHDIRREMPIDEAVHFIALGGDMRFAASRLLGGEPHGASPLEIAGDSFTGFCDQMAGEGLDAVAEQFRLPQSDAETLVPALLAYRELLVATSADVITVPDVSLRSGLLQEIVRRGEDTGRVADENRQVRSSAEMLGEKYRYHAAHAHNVAHLATRIFDDIRDEHGLGPRHRLLLEVAALLHDIGIFANVRGHHKHSQYLLSVSEVFGLSQEDMAVISNIARYHRKAAPQKSHLPYMALDRESRLVVLKLAAILRVANALDSDQLQKVRDVRISEEEGNWVLEADGSGDLTMERLVVMSRADLLTEVFGRKLVFRESSPRD